MGAVSDMVEVLSMRGRRGITVVVRREFDVERWPWSKPAPPSSNATIAHFLRAFRRRRYHWSVAAAARRFLSG